MASLDRRFALCRLDEAQRRLDFGLKMPELQMEADYDLKGHVLLLPIVGNGRASLKISESALFHLANDIPQLIARLLNTTFRIYCLNGTGPLKCFVTFPVSVFQWRLLLQRTRRRRCRRGSCWTRWKEKRWWRSSPWRWTLTSAPWTCSSTTSSTGTKSSVSPGPLLSWAELSWVESRDDADLLLQVTRSTLSSTRTRRRWWQTWRNLWGKVSANSSSDSSTRSSSTCLSAFGCLGTDLSQLFK